MSSCFVLASTSPRRLELLKQIGITPGRVEAPQVNEQALKGELPSAFARRMAEEKAKEVSARFPQAVVLAGDTVVACGRRIMPKCRDEEEIKRSLALLSGRRHRVYGGVAVMAPGGHCLSRLAQSAVTLRRLNEKEINAYAATGEGLGKAGGYALQGRAAAFIRFTSGSPSNIIGLPLYETAHLLQLAGYGSS